MTDAVNKPLAMVALVYPPGFIEATYSLVRSLVDSAGAAFVKYVPPTGWLVCFKPNEVALAELLVSKIHELRVRDERFTAIGAAAHAGVVIYETDQWGRVRSLPLGDVHRGCDVFVGLPDHLAYLEESPTRPISLVFAPPCFPRSSRLMSHCP